MRRLPSPRPSLLARLIAPLALALPAAAQPLRDPLLGTVTAPDGRPVEGAVVEAWRAAGRGTGLLDLAYKNDFRRVEVTRTGRDGRFALQLPVGLSCRIVVDHAPFAVWRRDDCIPGEDLTVALAEPAVVAGALTLADGSPATASLRAWNPHTSDELFRGRTDDAGRFRFARVAPGPMRLEIAPDRAPGPKWLDAPLASGQTFEHTVQLERGVRLVGRVVGEDGAAIAGARIGEGWTMFRAVTTGTDGRYELPGFGSTGRTDVHCVADGFVAQAVDRPQLAGDVVTLDFRLARGTAVAGRIVGAAGEPLAGVYVQAFGSAMRDRAVRHDCVPGITGADGRFRVAGLDPAMDHVLVARQDGRAMLVYTLPHADDHGAAVLGDLTLPAARCVRGVLTDPDGRPLANTRVALVGYNADRDALVARSDPPVAPDWRHFEMYVGTRRSRTDQLGRLAFGDVPAGSFEVIVLDANWQAIGRGSVFDVPADRDPAPLAVTLGR